MKPVNTIQETGVPAAGCSCEHCSSKMAGDLREDSPPAGDNNRRRRFSVVRILAGSLFFIAGIVFRSHMYSLPLFLASYVLLGFRVLVSSVGSVIKGRLLDENFLMLIASAGAMIIGEYPEAAGVMLFYSFGEYLQDRAVDRSRRSIQSLLQIKPDYANLEDEHGVRKVHPGIVDPGAIIIIKPGEKIPLDGRVVHGESVVDTSAITGEPFPEDISAGDEVYSGSVNLRGVIKVRVSRSFGESTVSRILTLVADASERKSRTENFITTFARYYTPVVVAVAALIAVVPSLLLEGVVTREWIYRGLIFLVVSCPCALVLSIPLAYFSGLGAASRKGILIKGGNFLDALASAKRVLFDKTGTLTAGRFSITAVRPVDGTKEEELLHAAAGGEYYSSHPVAEAIRKINPRPVDPARIEAHHELSGFGVKARVDGNEVIVGSGKLLEREQIATGDFSGDGLTVHVGVNGRLLGSLVLEDIIKPESYNLKKDLAALGVEELVMLTGDRAESARKTAGALNLDAYHAGLLPQDKPALMERYKGLPGTTVAVGDGINDAPLLAGADVGIAMGALGSDAAVEAADIVLMNDDPAMIAESIDIARRTRRIVWQNITLALGVKAVVMVLSAFGLAAMYQAIIADVGVALLAVANSARLIRG